MRANRPISRTVLAFFISGAIVFPTLADDDTLEFQAIVSGGAQATSSDYVLKDRIARPGDTATQTSADYTVTGDFDFDDGPTANNGLAIAIGTMMRVSWASAGPPPGIQGYLIYRKGPLGDRYVRMTEDPISATQYEDQNLYNGTYWYIVYCVDSHGKVTQWMQPISGTITDSVGPTSAKHWRLYSQHETRRPKERIKG